MLITGRQACRVLAGAGVSKRCALHVLASGLAGDATRAGAVVLYDHARVEELARRPVVAWSEVCELGLTGEVGVGMPGFFVSRREFPATGSRADQLESLGRGWGSVCPWSWVAMSLQIKRYGSFPFLATIGGLVVLGAEIVETRGLSELVLESPGPWFDALEGGWFPTGPGRPWVLHLGPLTGELSLSAA
jgi:hypothetical protein